MKKGHNRFLVSLAWTRMYQLATTSISQSEYKYLSFHTLHVWFYFLQTVPWGTSGNYALFVFAGQCLHVWETFGRRITLITSGPCISWDGRPTDLTQASRWDTVLLRRYEKQKKVVSVKQWKRYRQTGMQWSEGSFKNNNYKDNYNSYYINLHNKGR